MSVGASEMLSAIPARADPAAARSDEPILSHHGRAVISMPNLM
jgi:hypothetical protein